MASYSSSSDAENSEDEMDDLDSDEQEASGLFLKRHKRFRSGNKKDWAMLGVFAEESEDDSSGLAGKQLRYKHVRFTSPGHLNNTYELNERYAAGKVEEDSEVDRKDRLKNPSSASKVFPSTLNDLQTFERSRQNSPSMLTDSNVSKHFKNFGLGAKMMEKMGYVVGKGLGSQGQGILNPVETKVRPTRAGLGSIKERTEKDVEKSKKSSGSASEEEQRLKKQFEDKQEKKHKNKIKHKTASEIAGDMEVPLVLQQIIDMTGKDIKLIENVSGTMSIPATLSHNDEMYQISQIARRDLDMHAKEWKQLQDRKSYIKMEETRINEKINQESIRIQKLENIIEEMEKIYLFCKNSSKDSLEILNDISQMLEKVQFEFSEEIETYHLNEVVVSILFPIIKQIFLSWDPLKEPTLILNLFCKWKNILDIENIFNVDEINDSLLLKQRIMSPFESMLQHLWVPRVRSAINNTWNPHNPSPVLFLFESWKNLLSPFIQDFILNQLVLPKLQKSVSSWDPRSSIKKKNLQLPHIWLFPWLPLLKENTETLIDDVKRKFKTILNSWDIKDGPIEELNAWREIFGDNQFEKLMLNYLLPKLSICLRLDFHIDPSDQKLEPLEWVLPWRVFFKPSVFEQLFASEFFPKWMDILYLWLTDPECNYAQVSEWYQWWQEVFPSEMLEMPMIRESFVKGLDMMHQALDLGKDVSEKLPPPVVDFINPIEIKIKESPLPKKHTRQLDIDDVKFKDVVEEFCMEHDLILIPLRKAHEGTGNPLFRITASASGTGGILVYIKGDVVWVQNIKNKNEFNPESLNNILTLTTYDFRNDNLRSLKKFLLFCLYKMRAIKDVYTHLTSKNCYTYPEPSSVLVSIMSTEFSAIENIEKQPKNISRRSSENVIRNRPRSRSPVYFTPNSVGEMNLKFQDQNAGYSSYFGYERTVIKGDNDYYRWLQDYAKRDTFTDWIESAFGKSVGR
ncbi:hypothetical protein PORY_001625 [Pneumocystis oryctolagi]|uniref:Uncharacterized protein n=1 Tax=Pneumocystis oryctolagi TaxID=42067 RepID=A0ACB7CC22_9ASCO|nr:hypothetical protein PORY_001625 [Pneumocystis oryctolagi]